MLSHGAHRNWQQQGQPLNELGVSRKLSCAFGSDEHRLIKHFIKSRNLLKSRFPRQRKQFVGANSVIS
jgi:hypothetical protein